MFYSQGYQREKTEPTPTAEHSVFLISAHKKQEMDPNDCKCGFTNCKNVLIYIMLRSCQMGLVHVNIQSQV